MEDFDELFKKIKEKKAKIGVIGLGYVGLPLAILFAKQGFLVTGFVRNKKRAWDLNQGKNHLSEPIDKGLKEVINQKKLVVTTIESSSLQNQDLFIICVPTPVDENKKPDLSALRSVAKKLATINLSGKLVINESTVTPFTTREVFGSFKGHYFLVCSPERIDPGNKKKTTQNIPKVVGGKDKESLVLAKNLYQQILTEKIVEVSSLEAAEMVKMLENTYRAVNIALINEFAKLTEACGLDILEIIEAAKSKWSFQAHYPSIGVGGHCIPVDPYYILDFGEKKGMQMKVVRDGLLENEEMPYFVAEKVKKIYRDGMKVLVYGLTYKKDVNDLRESPVVTLCNLLKNQGIDFRAYDPLLDSEKIKELGFKPGFLKRVDLFIVGTDHNQLKKDYLKAVGSNSIIIDGRNFFISKKGKATYGVGRVLL